MSVDGARFAGVADSYLRFPHLHGDLLAFVAELPRDHAQRGLRVRPGELRARGQGEQRGTGPRSGRQQIGRQPGLGGA